eukprot:scaffold3257_cov87-Skeletonema_marinoi.AAC.6
MPYASADGAEGKCSADVFDDAVGAWVAVGYAIVSTSVGSHGEKDPSVWCWWRPAGHFLRESWSVLRWKRAPCLKEHIHKITTRKTTRMFSGTQTMPQLIIVPPTQGYLFDKIGAQYNNEGAPPFYAESTNMGRRRGLFASRDMRKGE